MDWKDIFDTLSQMLRLCFSISLVTMRTNSHGGSNGYRKQLMVGEEDQDEICNCG